ncbi:MAG: DUF432 domain-containing protein [Myxococcales bacterium]|nr:DUF432 domain-containing protein [Myxococcales bacterium]
MTSGAKDASDLTWWGDVRVEPGKAARWLIGPLELYIERREGDWRVGRRVGKDLLSEDYEPRTDLDGAPDDVKDVDRFVAHSNNDVSCAIAPALPDRALVVAPESPFHVPPGTKATIYMSTPVWLQFRLVGAADSPVLLDIPIARPSDTWFGDSTKEGVLCYASRTFARLSLAEITRRAHRAVTAAHIDNKARTPLTLKRVCMPVDSLALFAAADGRLFTQDVVLSRKDEHAEDYADVSLGDKQPLAAPDAKRIVEPRKTLSGNFVTRAFARLFE